MGICQNKQLNTVSESESESEDKRSPLSEMKIVDIKRQTTQLNHEQIRLIYYYEYFHTRFT